jgi:arylsulfatase A-like enzyme
MALPPHDPRHPGHRPGHQPASPEPEGVPVNPIANIPGQPQNPEPPQAGAPAQPLPPSAEGSPGQLPADVEGSAPGGEYIDQSLPGVPGAKEPKQRIKDAAKQHPRLAQAAYRKRNRKPNVVYFHVDNLGYGELGCYGGGLLRGAPTSIIDNFAKEGFQLLNFAPEAQCTPSRTALMVGRYAIRTGNHTVSGSGSEAGIVAWERTLGDIFSEAGYATAILGKWHIGDCPGRWPCDHGFDTWYGPPHSYDESLWERDPWYQAGRDPVTHMMEQKKGEEPVNAEKLTYDLKRNVDTEYLKRAKEFMRRNKGQPFFLYYNPTLMHLPNVPRDEYAGKSGNGQWADCLLQMDGDFGVLLDELKRLELEDDTIVVLAGDNGNEEALLHRGSSGFWDGSYFTGMEASLRTPCLMRWPGVIQPGASNDIMHITDMFTTLLSLADLPIPDDRVIDGIDQSDWLTGEQEYSNREGFLFWNGAVLYGVKWHDFKLLLVRQKYLTDPALNLSFPAIINLMTDPKEREPFNQLYMHTWTLGHFGKLMGQFGASLAKEPMIPAGAPLDYVPTVGEPEQERYTNAIKLALLSLIPENWWG